MNHDPQSEIVLRLQCAAGHLNAVIRMVKADQSCEQVLQQLVALQGALDAVARKVIACEVHNCEEILLESRSSRRKVAQLQRLQSLYRIINQHPNKHSEVLND